MFTSYKSKNVNTLTSLNSTEDLKIAMTSSYCFYHPFSTKNLTDPRERLFSPKSVSRITVVSNGVHGVVVWCV